MRKKISCVVIGLIVLAFCVFFGYIVQRIVKSPQSDDYSWRSSQIPAKSGYAGDMHIAVSLKGSVFVSTFGGKIFRSRDSARHWEQVNSVMNNCTIWSIAVDRKGTVYAGTGRGVYRSTDDGEHWSLANNGLPVMAPLSWCMDSTDRIYIGTTEGQLFCSSDGGDHWKKIAATGKNPDHSHDIYSIAVNSKGTIFFGTQSDGIYRSTDDGKHWKNLTPELAHDAVEDSYSMLDSIAIDSSDNIYVASDVSFYNKKDSTSDSYVMTSIDGGNHWTKLFFGIGARCNTVAANSSGKVVAGTNQGLFISTNGKKWRCTNCRKFFGLMPSIESVAIDSKGVIYAVSPTGKVYCGTPNKQKSSKR